MFELRGITKKFDERIILDKLSFTINDSEFVAIKGPSGSGKTTLLNIIGLLDNDYQGDLIYDGKSMKKMNDHHKSLYVRNNINYLFQNYALIEDDSIEDNLALALEYPKLSKANKLNKINKALKIVGLDLNPKQKIYKLSGGEQQRIALARALIKPAKLILCDEPTGNLDAYNRDLVVEILKELRKYQKTIIVVTHDDAVADKADRVLKL